MLFDVPQEVLDELNESLEHEAKQYSQILKDRVKTYELIEQDEAKEFHQPGKHPQKRHAGGRKKGILGQAASFLKGLLGQDLGLYDVDAASNFEFGVLMPEWTSDDGFNHITRWINEEKNKWAFVEHDNDGDFFGAITNLDDPVIQDLLKND